MNIYLISQDVVDGYDTFDSAVVVAKNKDDARTIHPCSYVTHVTNKKWMGTYASSVKHGGEYEYISCREWVTLEDISKVEVKLVGLADDTMPRGVILASFNAG